MSNLYPTVLGLCCMLVIVSCQPNTQSEFWQSTYENKHAPADHFYLQRAYPDGTFSEEAYKAALAEASSQMNLREGLPPGFSETWSLKGPGNIGARVNTIAVHPTNEKIIYAGFSCGGVYKTKDGGLNWVPIFDDRAYLAIGAIAIDPSNPEIVYVGTGDPNITGYPFLGDGLYRSTNGGQSWSRIGLAETRIISKIVIDPSNPQRIHVGTMGLPFERNRQRGLYSTTDGGLSWKQSLFVNEQAGIIDIVMDPKNPSTLYAAAWNRIRNNRESIISGPDAAIYKSTNNGQSWTILTGGLPTGNMGRIGLAFYSGTPNQVFAIYNDDTAELENIFRTSDEGNTWEPLILPGKSNLPRTVLGGFGWYFGKIKVNPKNPLELYLLSISLWKTSDGGRTWITQGDGEVHSDKHDLVFTPSGDLLLGSDGGIDKSTDGGSSWIDIESIPTTQFYRIDYNPHNPNRYYGGAQDHGTVSGNDINQSWQRIEGGDGFQMRFNPIDAQVVWAQTQNGTLRVSTNGGSYFQLALVGIDRSERVNWDAPLIISPHDPEILYTGTQRIYQNSTGTSPLWRAISPDLTDGNIFGRNFHNISCIHESPLNPDLLMAGTSDGNVWQTNDRGNNWNRIDATLPERYVTSVKTSPSNASTLYVSHSGYKDNDNQAHLRMSLNLGKTWTSIAGDLPPLAINDFIVLPGHQDSILFVANDGGVYASTNFGKNWNRLGTNMPIVAAYCLAWNVAKNELVVGTHGKSIYAYPLRKLLNGNVTSTKFATLPDNLLKVYPQPFDATLNLDWETPDLKSNWILKIFDIQGKTIFGQSLGMGPVQKLQLNTSHWNKGVYWLQLSDGHRQISKKLIKI